MTIELTENEKSASYDEQMEILKPTLKSLKTQGQDAKIVMNDEGVPEIQVQSSSDPTVTKSIVKEVTSTNNALDNSFSTFQSNTNLFCIGLHLP